MYRFTGTMFNGNEFTYEIDVDGLRYYLYDVTLRDDSFLGVFPDLPLAVAYMQRYARENGVLNVCRVDNTTE